MSAREAMAEKNLKEVRPQSSSQEWHPVYRPDPASGKLVELLPQPGPRNESWHWHQEVPSWLRDRLKWRDAEGVPITADWKHISDLQV